MRGLYDPVRLFPSLLLIAALAGPAAAQPVAPPPSGLPAAEAAIWPFPPPDPKSWWDEKRPKAPEAADPLAGRRLERGDKRPKIDGAADPSTYRLWGLMPLQWQVLRGDEMILEVWVRPARSVRQSVVRITVRRDGHAFLQGRAGMACCEAQIGRRIGFDDELPAASAAGFLALRTHPMWKAPKQVSVMEGGGATEAVCVDGASYDLVLLTPNWSRTLRRACDNAAIGQAADALEPVLRAALGHDTRFDVLFPGGIDFSAAREAYLDLIRQGGGLIPNADATAAEPAAP